LKRNRVVVPARRAIQGSLESILGLLKSLTIQALYTNHCMTQQASLGTVMIMMIMSMMVTMMAGWLAGGRSCPALSLVVGGVVVITTTGAGVLLLVRMVCVAAQQMCLKKHTFD
jgi:hypothetical protein